MSQTDRQAVILYRDHGYRADELGHFFGLGRREAEKLYKRARRIDLGARCKLLDAIDALRGEGAGR